MEPERKIEKWLKAYAKKRRTQADDPFKLHPATRRLLQSEVARDQPKSDDEDESVSLWEVIRQQWAILLSFAACIFLVGIILLPVTYYAAKKKSQTLATVSGARETANAPAVVSEEKLQASLGEKKDLDLAHHGLAGEETNAVLLADDRKAFVDRDTVSATNNAPFPTVAMTVTPSAAPAMSESIKATPLEISPGPSTATPPSPVVAGGDYMVTRQPESSASVSNSLNGSYASQPTPPPLVAAAAPNENLPTGQAGEQFQEAAPGAMPPVETPASEQNAAALQSWALSKSELHAATSRQLGELQNVYKNSVALLPATPVLANFQVQQNGNAIRLVDQDGSVYEGSLQPMYQKTEDQSELDANRRAMQNAVTVVAGLPSQQITAAQDALQLAQTYFFHVYGTNRTMKQTVAFTGSLTVNSASTNSANLAFGLTDHAVNSRGGGFGGVGGGGGGGAVGSTFDRTKSEATNQLAQLPWANLRITGTAVVNRTNRIEIDAAPVAPNKN